MKLLNIALYRSDDKNDKAYWDIEKVAERFDISIWTAKAFNWGGQEIFTVSGEDDKLDKFAKEFCNAENINELVEAV